VGVTWQGLVLAAAGQAAAVLGIGWALRLPRRSTVRMAALVLASDFVIALLLIVLAAASTNLNHGSHYRRGMVIMGHLILALALPWAVWGTAIRAAARRPVPVGGGILAALTAIGLAAPGVRLSDMPGPAQVTRLQVPLRRLPKALDGLTIILVSDTHVGPRVSAARARDRLAPMRRLKADLFVCTGDLGTRSRAEIRAAARMLRETAPKGPRFAVLGNHERWTDQTLAVRELGRNGFNTLVNDAQRLILRGAEFFIVGVNDPATGAANLRLALAKVPRDAFVILLAHSPDILADPLASRADLILAGHTHGGQVVLPMLGPLAASSFYGPRYASGLSQVAGSKMFVTRGLGEVIVSLRLLCPPEIAVLTLRAAPRRPN